MMSRSALTATVLLAGLAMAGCGSETPESHGPTPDPPKSPRSPPPGEETASCLV